MLKKLPETIHNRTTASSGRPDNYIQNIQNRLFQDLFREEEYLVLKNYLYNYRLRKRAVEKCLQSENLDRILEVGSGISPLTTHAERTIFSDVSVDAIRFLKHRQRKGYYVVADGRHLPFKPQVFSHAICSEVLEHIEDDLAVLKELKCALKKPSGCLVMTVPHRKCYFTNDDYFVKHYRRYEVDEIRHKLSSIGLKPILVRKVLGPLEKVTMSLGVFLYSVLQHKLSEKKPLKRSQPQVMNFLAPFFEWANLFYQGFVWLDARIMPMSLSTVILIMSVLSENEKPLEHSRSRERK